MLQTDLAHNLIAALPLQLPLRRLYPRRAQQQVGCNWGADVEVKGAVGADSYACWNWGAGLDVCGSSVEFLEGFVSNELEGGFEAYMGFIEALLKVCTLQKSIDFTPLLPSAGPTGGLGLAWPAPTISFTI